MNDLVYKSLVFSLDEVPVTLALGPCAACAAGGISPSRPLERGLQQQDSNVGGTGEAKADPPLPSLLYWHKQRAWVDHGQLLNPV